jgi:hypothetical protein
MKYVMTQVQISNLKNIAESMNRNVNTIFDDISEYHFQLPEEKPIRESFSEVTDAINAFTENPSPENKSRFENSIQTAALQLSYVQPAITTAFASMLEGKSDEAIDQDRHAYIAPLQSLNRNFINLRKALQSFQSSSLST